MDSLIDCALEQMEKGQVVAGPKYLRYVAAYVNVTKPSSRIQFPMNVPINIPSGREKKHLKSVLQADK